jgi:heterodisulfide reductase subunit A-like polyferredoxin
MLISSGYVCQVNHSLCFECDICFEVCPFDALSYENGRVMIDQVKCMGCGICVSVCPMEALSMVLDPSKPAPLEIQKLIQENSEKVVE